MTFRLAHISDIHLGPLPKAGFRDLLSKRVTGYVNWHRNRGKKRDPEILSALLERLQIDRSDHLAITGDLINIGLDEEIENAGLWLEALGKPKNVTVVPGNHDAYVRDTLAKALARWQGYITGDDGADITSNDDFPTLRIRDNVAIIGVNSAIVTAPFVAAGRVETEQCERLTEILMQAAKDALFRVVLIHHPPIRGATRPQKRLYGIGNFQRTILEVGAELILHGHTHLPQRHVISDRFGRQIPVLGVPSASEGLDGRKPASGYNLFEIERDENADAWRLAMRYEGYTGPASGFTMREQRVYDIPFTGS
ncbi:MAG: metallophosphoesterase [Pseudomonadota bacterium]